MFQGFFTLWRLAFRRARSRWRILLPLLAGAVLAASLMSSTAVYGDAVRRLGLQRTLASYDPARLDINLQIQHSPSNPDTYAAVKTKVDTSVFRRVLWFVDNASRDIRGETFYVNQVARGQEAVDTSPAVIAGAPAVRADPRRRMFFAASADFARETTIVSGATPQPLTVALDPQGRPLSTPEVQATVLEETARVHNLAVGDRLLIVSFRDEMLTHAVVRVAAIARPNDPAARYWKGNLQRRVSLSHGENFAPVFVSQDTYFLGVAHLFPKMLSDFTWTLFVNPAKIDVDSAYLAQYSVDDLQRQLRSDLNNYFGTSDLSEVLQKFQQKELFGRIPLLIMVLMILGIVGYYLVMVAGVVVERHSGEVALLRSRGAGAFQVLTLYLWEALAISTVAFFAGPPLALLGASLLGLTPAFSGLTDGAMLPVKMSTAAYGYALGGAVLAFAAMLLPTIGAARLNPLRHRLGVGRPAGQSFLTRYYIDVLVTIVALFLYWELTQRGSVVNETLFGGRGVDQALLAAPALFMAAIALLVLRLFPLLLRLLARIASGFTRAWLVMALWHMGRNPVPYTRPLLLLMLAASVAMFAANFGATVDRSYLDRARYVSGGDLALQQISLSRGGPSIAFGAAVAVPGAQRTPVFRSRAFRSQVLTDSSTYSLLAVDPQSFGTVAWSRDDFAAQPLNRLVAGLDPGAAAPGAAPALGLLLPPDAASLRVWVQPATQRRDLQLSARLADANGRYVDVVLGVMRQAGWQSLEASLSQIPRGVRLPPFGPQHPLRLVSLTVVQIQGDSMFPGAYSLDRVEAIARGGIAPVLSFQPQQAAGPGLRVVRDVRAASGDSFDVSTSIVRPGSAASGLFVWGAGPLAAPRGFLLGADAGGPDLPLAPALVSRTAAQRQQLSPGDQLSVSVGGHNLSIRIAAIVDYFPTLDPYEDDGFLVVGLPAFLQRINEPETVIDWQANELWFAVEPGASRAAARAALAAVPGGRIVDRDALRETYRADPLIAAGWHGVLLMAFLAVVAVTLLGFSLYSVIRAQQRRVEFALLRSMGISRPGLAGMVLTEQAVIIVLGLGLGALIGYQLTALLLPFLGLTEEGARVLPPYVTRVNWPAILASYGAIAGIFLASTVGLVVFFARLGIQRAIRFGDA